MRSRNVVIALALVAAFALMSGSVLLIGYAAAAASLLIIVTLVVRKAFGRRSASATSSPVPRWVDSTDREAA